MILNVGKGLSVGYGRRIVATSTEDLSFRRGEMTLVLGLNGRGKTTLMKTLACLLPPVAGKVQRTRSLYVSNEIDFPENLTCRDTIWSLDPEARFRKLGFEFLAALKVPEKKYGVLSEGERQKARIVVAEVVSASCRVQLILMDEPFSGLDFHAREYFGHRLETRAEERHIIISLHPSEIPIVPNQILLVSRGEIFSVPSAMPWPEIRSILQPSPCFTVFPTF
jgi:ABC-type multidrug transport system ATPase subunit